MRHLFFLTAETMVGILHHVPFTLFVEIMETLAISVWDNSVSITMKYTFWTLIVHGSFVYWQVYRRSDVVAS